MKIQNTLSLIKYWSLPKSEFQRIWLASHFHWWPVLWWFPSWPFPVGQCSLLLFLWLGSCSDLSSAFLTINIFRFLEKHYTDFAPASNRVICFIPLSILCYSIDLLGFIRFWQIKLLFLTTSFMHFFSIVNNHEEFQKEVKSILFSSLPPRPFLYYFLYFHILKIVAHFIISIDRF